MQTETIMSDHCDLQNRASTAVAQANGGEMGGMGGIERAAKLAEVWAQIEERDESQQTDLGVFQVPHFQGICQGIQGDLHHCHCTGKVTCRKKLISREELHKIGQHLQSWGY